MEKKMKSACVYTVQCSLGIKIVCLLAKKDFVAHRKLGTLHS